MICTILYGAVVTDNKMFITVQLSKIVFDAMLKNLFYKIYIKLSSMSTQGPHHCDCIASYLILVNVICYTNSVLAKKYF